MVPAGGPPPTSGYNDRVRYLGVDPGGQRFGLAVGDDETGIATPLEVIAYHGVARAAETIVDYATRFSAGIVVLGLPTNAHGEPSPACRRSYALAEALRQRGMEVVYQREYLSTREARERARAVGLLEEYLGGSER
jgi:putative Holliday junction resolvase